MSDLAPVSAYILPAILRGELAEPWGPVLTGAELGRHVRPHDLLITVGDVVSLTALELGLKPNLMIVDGRTQRGPLPPTDAAKLAGWGREVRVVNPAARINRIAWLAVRDAFRQKNGKPVRMVVEGEEDLLGIPCILEAPDGAVVLYGMPGRGIAFVRVDDAVRSKVAGIVARFETAR